jgi:hypothetical protein
MGKSIVHCSVCGKRVREEDFAERKALTVEYRTYCADCVPADLKSAQPATPRPGSTSRIPMAGATPRHGVPAVREKSKLPLLIGLAGAGIVVAIVAVVALSGGKQAPEAGAPVTVVPARPKAVAAPEVKKDAAPAPVEPQAPAVTPEPPVVKVEKETPAPPPTPAPVTAKPLAPVITFPADGATFAAPAAITIFVEVSGEPAKVEFYEGAVKLGEAAQRPFSLPWNNVAAGTYTLTAKLTARDGETAMSASVIVRVSETAAAPLAEDRKPAPAPAPGAAPLNFGVDPKRVDAAIAKGIAFLKSAGVKDSMDPALPGGLHECPELMLWTMVHARVPENDPDFVKLFNYMTSRKMERVYAVALQAMILEELNRVKYQARISACAQFLIDAQCGNGQWSYGGTVRPGVASGGLKLDVSTPGGAGQRVKPPVTRKVTLRKMYEGPPAGDNSNSQYAALGVRACSDAGVVIPKGVVLAAQTWWRISQHEAAKSGGVATDSATFGPAGWCYGPKDHGHASYAAMTAGAVGALAILNYLEDPTSARKDPTLQRGLAWLGANFSLKTQEGPPEHCKESGWMLYYYLYALERAGVLAGTETFGAHKWYVEGAEAILAAQKPNGSWLAPFPHPDRSDTTNAVWDTCFAILFLKRATAPLVASTDGRVQK